MPKPATSERPWRRASYRWMHRFSLLTAAATLLLILAGAMVTSTGSGLAVPDWPLSYGRWMPPMVGGIFWEHGHRMIAGTVGIFMLVLSLWLWRAEDRRWVRRLGGLALLAVVAQAVLGGITVRWFLPAPVSVAHATLAQTFFCMVTALAVVTSRRWREAGKPEPEPSGVPFRWLALALVMSVYGQLVLGAVFRHTGRILLAHILVGLVVLALALWTAGAALVRHAKRAVLMRPALLLGVLAPIQVCLGFGALVLRTAEAETIPPPLWWSLVRSSHVATGALILAAAVVLAVRTLRSLAPRTRGREEAPMPSDLTSQPSP